MEGHFWCGPWLDTMKHVISLVPAKWKILRPNKIVLCCIPININAYLFLRIFFVFSVQENQSQQNQWSAKVKRTEKSYHSGIVSTSFCCFIGDQGPFSKCFWTKVKTGGIENQMCLLKKNQHFTTGNRKTSKVRNGCNKSIEKHIS